GVGRFMPEWITVDALVRLIEACGPGVTEIACHPGDGTDPDIPTMYKRERAFEVAAVCHPLARDAVRRQGMRLASYLDLVGAPAGGSAVSGTAGT
ncbi:MAG TPA: hypothetical protein VNN79_20575, partial [Actinomycetota bacterium]|nr:hypothetical protein [Actinomycetota bacterium]